MIFSKTCNYGFRAVLYIAKQPERNFISIREISEKLNIPFHFLTKILQLLTHKNILHSVKGPKGGVALAKDAHFISLLEIMVAIDGTHVFKQCFLGVEECTENHYCPLHNNWIELREQLLGILGKTTLAKFTTEVKESNFQLAF